MTIQKGAYHAGNNLHDADKKIFYKLKSPV